MCPTGSTPVATLSNLAQFTAIGNALVAGGQANAILRIGWEPNGSGQPWGSGTVTGAQYAAAFQAIVTTMRACAGQAFAFDFNTNLTSFGFADSGSWDTWYPGDSYVDICSVDFYENGYPQYYAANMEGVAAKAATHSKPWAIGEWGLNSSSTIDAPYYITNIGQLIRGELGYPAPLYQCYFDGSHSTLNSSVPQSVDAYKAAFTGVATTWLQQSFLVAVSGTGLSTVTVQPYKVGDLCVFISEINANGKGVASLASSNITWNSSASIVDDNTTEGNRIEIWFGTATATTSATLTVSWTTSIGSTATRLTFFDYSSPSGYKAPFSVVAAAKNDAGAGVTGTTVTWPALTSLSWGTGLYVGATAAGNAGDTGLSSGFTLFLNATGSPIIFNGALAASTTYTPTITQPSADKNYTVGVIYTATQYPSGLLAFF
jgi:hypothetical protein